MSPRRPQEASKTRIPLVSGGSWPPRGPKRPPRRPKRPPRGRQDPPKWPQGGQHRSKLASKMEPKSNKNRWTKSIENVMHLGIDFWKDFGGFWMPKWGKVESKMGSKIDVNFERRFFKKHYFSFGKTTFLRSKRSKSRVKIDQKIECKIQCILASIF